MGVCIGTHVLETIGSGDDGGVRGRRFRSRSWEDAFCADVHVVACFKW